MSQIKIIVRQPPNRDFLEGFPGIPPNPPERPHAALRGTVELRVQGGTPVKAKWVQIELKKIETLLQGQGEPYVETIGHAPKIWTANGEYENLQVRDFPFYIQIPMNVPPSIALEKGSGIRYEMVASLCVKGKKGILRKDKNNVTSTSVPIVMDKHELHTLWPVYHRPQTSTATNDGLNLIVARDASCYGPGDSVTAHVELRSGRGSPCILRTWEMTLREHVIFRPDPSQLHNGKQAPVASGQQYRHNVIAEQKKSLSKTIYDGVTVSDELACLIPMQHRTATTQGRLIEVQFTLSVKAVMESAGSVEVMMPVLMSHWSRETSENSLRKIGPVPHLGINFPAAQAAKPQPQGYSQVPSNGQLTAPPLESPPVRPPMTKSEMPEEVGPPSPPYTPPETGSNFSSQQTSGRPNGRSRESTITSRNRPLAVVNMGPQEESSAAARPAVQPIGSQPYKASWETAEEEKKRLKEEYTQEQNQSSSSAPVKIPPTPASPAAKPVNFGTAEEEKKRLYDRAQAQARRTQELARKEAGLPAKNGASSLSRETSASASESSAILPSTASESSAMRPSTPNTVTSAASSVPLTPPTTAAKSPSIRSGVTGHPPNWSTAEAEKERLYRQAQRRARETQARVASGAGGGSVSGRSRSGSNTSLTSMQTQRQSTAATIRPTSTFKLNNPDPSEEQKPYAPVPVNPSFSPAPVPVATPPPAPAPAPALINPPSSAAIAAAAMYAQALAAQQSQPQRASASPPAQSMSGHASAYSPSPQSSYGHNARASQSSSSAYGQPSGSQGAGLPQLPSYGGSGLQGVVPGPGRNWVSAEDEKSQLNRYYEAKRAVATRDGTVDETADAYRGSSSSSYAPAHAASPPPADAPRDDWRDGSSPAGYQAAARRVPAASPSPSSHVASPSMRMSTVRQEQTPSPVLARAYSSRGSTPPQQVVGYAAPPADYFNSNIQRTQTPPRASPAPPAFSPSAQSGSPPPPMDEKERMKLFFEAQDATRRFQETQGSSGSGSRMSMAPPPPVPSGSMGVAAAPSGSSSSSYANPPSHAGPPGYDEPPPSFDGGSGGHMSALEEKARLAREYQQQHAVPTPPMRSASIHSVRSPGPSYAPVQAMSPVHSPLYGGPALPTISTQYTSPVVLQRNLDSFTKYIPSPIEEEPPVGPPPPLMPRPPQEYIEQILREEEGHVAPAPVERRPSQARQGSWDPQPLNFRPVSPFSIPLPHQAQSPPPPQWQQQPSAQPQYGQQQQYGQPGQAPSYR